MRRGSTRRRDTDSDHTESTRLVVGRSGSRHTFVWWRCQVVPGHCSSSDLAGRTPTVRDTRNVSRTPVAESSIAVDSASNITWFPSSKRPATTSRVGPGASECGGMCVRRCRRSHRSPASPTSRPQGCISLDRQVEETSFSGEECPPTLV